MTQFIKKNKITFDIKSTESIRHGLKQYEAFIRSEEGFTEEMFDFSDIYFEEASGKELCLGDFSDTTLVGALYSEKTGTPFDPSKPSTPLAPFLLSETLFFMVACQHPELKEEIIHAARAIVNYSLKHNDSSDMWINDTEVFGLDVLYVIAWHFSEYAYLMGSYIIPYWDTEHADYAMEYPAWLVARYGITRDTIKMFVYCDNSEARSRMFQFTDKTNDLLTHFRKNREDYAWFKETVQTRFTHQPYLQYSSGGEDHNDRPIESLYLSMLTDYHDYDCDEDDNLELLAQPFVLDNADNEAADLHNKIEAFLGRPIVPPYVDEDDDDDDYYYRWEARDNWRAFIEGAIENGSAVWGYIANGDNPDILEGLTPVDVRALAKKGGYKIEKIISWHVGGLDSVREEFHAIIQDLTQDYCHEDGSSEEIEHGNAVILRTLDVFYRLFGKRPFAIDTVELVTDTWEIIDGTDFQARYGGDWYTSFALYLKEFTGYHDTVFGKALQRCAALLNKNRTEAKDQMVELFQRKDSGLLALAAHILFNDFNANRADEVTTHLSTYVETHLFEAAYKEIEENAAFPSDQEAQDFEKKEWAVHMRPDANAVEQSKAAWEDWKRIKAYIKGMEAMRPPRDILMKAMKVGKVGLTPEELALLQPPKVQLIPEEEALALLQKHLTKGDKKISVHQPCYELFNMSDHIQKLQVAAFYLGLMPLACSKAAARLLHLMALLAPVKTIRNLSYIHRDSYRDAFMKGVVDEMDFEENLERLKFPKPGIWAWKLERCQDKDEMEPAYRTLMTMAAEGETEEDNNTLFGKIHARNKAALTEGILLLPQSTRFQFHKEVYKTFPETGTTQVEEIFFTAMEDLLRGNLLGPENLFLNQVGKKACVHEWCYAPGDLPLPENIVFDISGEEARAMGQENQKSRDTFWLVVLQGKTGSRCLTNEWLGYMLCHEGEERFYQTHTRMVVVSDDCDPEPIAALQRNLGTPHFKETLAGEVMGYIKGEAAFEGVLPIATLAIDDFDDLSGASYYECGVSGTLWSMDEATRLRALKFMTAACRRGFDAGESEFEGTFSDYIDYVKQVAPPLPLLFDYILKEENSEALCALTKEHDITPFIKELKPQERLTALTLLKSDSALHPLVLSFEKDRSRKIRDLVESIKPPQKVEEARHTTSDFTLVDFGTYAMAGPMDKATSEGASVVVNGPRLLKETQTITAAPGTTFGFRFTSHNERFPKVLDHVVRVLHPEISGPDGPLTQSSWKQNGYTQSRTFAGWAFETADECVAGAWTIEIWNDDETALLVSQRFNVETHVDGNERSQGTPQ